MLWAVVALDWCSNRRIRVCFRFDLKCIWILYGICITGEPVAIKLIDLNDPVKKCSVVREANAIPLRHTNIIRILKVCLIIDNLNIRFITMLSLSRLLILKHKLSLL